MRYDPGVASDYSYFAPAGNFLSLFELFEACVVLRQSKTATVSIEFSKEVKYSMPKEENRPKRRMHLRRNQHKKAIKKMNTRQKKKNACGAVIRTKKTPAAKQTQLVFSPAAKKDPHNFFRLRRQRCGTGKSVVRQAAPYLRENGLKNGIYDKKVRQRNVSPPILRPAWQYNNNIAFVSVQLTCSAITGIRGAKAGVSPTRRNLLV